MHRLFRYSAFLAMPAMLVASAHAIDRAALTNNFEQVQTTTLTETNAQILRDWIIAVNTETTRRLNCQKQGLISSNTGCISQGASSSDSAGASAVIQNAINGSSSGSPSGSPTGSSSGPSSSSSRFVANENADFGPSQPSVPVPVSNNPTRSSVVVSSQPAPAPTPTRTPAYSNQGTGQTRDR